MARLLEEVYVAYHGLLTDFVAQLNPALARDRAAMIALMIGAHIDGVMIVRYRGAPAMPASDDEVIAAMKDVWLREIFPSLPQQAPSAPATRKHARSLRARHRM